MREWDVLDASFQFTVYSYQHKTKKLKLKAKNHILVYRISYCVFRNKPIH